MRLRFTTRDLLWLAALVAVCVAWWGDHWLLANKTTAQEMEIERMRVPAKAWNNLITGPPFDYSKGELLKQVYEHAKADDDSAPR